MCLQAIFLCTCHHLSHFSADFGGPTLIMYHNLTLEIMEIVNHSFRGARQDVFDVSFGRTLTLV